MIFYYIQMTVVILLSILHFKLLKENYILKKKRIIMEFRVITSNGEVPINLMKMLKRWGLTNVKELRDKILSEDVCIPIVQFTSLEQLIIFIKEVNHPIIIRRDTFYKENEYLIEIYNDFRESHL